MEKYAQIESDITYVKAKIGELMKSKRPPNINTRSRSSAPNIASGSTVNPDAGVGSNLDADFSEDAHEEHEHNEDAPLQLPTSTVAEFTFFATPATVRRISVEIQHRQFAFTEYICKILREIQYGGF
ncbi:hypothetical protein K7X08_014218 [Anisodus acutangulus]|uniref:Uncharacterized protein n=1 Tax=Anisodus acutangulus TaxID=402998 RepID=A0A9Q1LI47_9SOLA|nr:hypothetical protein K7X08_014218 [Anisodus acutangulus]